nr:hypothetical protein Cplu_406 [Cedratvirus plubellavi]
MENFVMKPEFSGMFNSSCRGIPVDVLKSWLQKAIRRGLEEDAVYAALCLFSFYLEEGLGPLQEEVDVKKWSGRSIFSNLMNRFIVIGGEDIGIGALKALFLIDSYVEFFREEITQENFTDCVLQFINLVVFMCRQPKSRLVSTSRVLIQDEPFIREMIPELPEWKEEIEKNTDPVDRVIYVLQNRDRGELFSFLAVKYAYELHLNKEKQVIERRMGKDVTKKRKVSCFIVYKLWNIYLDDGDELIQLLYKWYTTENENWIYLVLATLTFVTAEVNRECVMNKKTDLSLEEIYQRALRSELSPPDWAVDKHTKEGRNKGKGAMDFAKEGAKIENAWHYSPQVLERLYMRNKEEYDKKLKLAGKEPVRKVTPPVEREETLLEYDFTLSEEQVQEIRDSLRGQLITSSSKRPVYLTHNYAYKGPFPDEKKFRQRFAGLRKRMDDLQKLGTKFVRVHFGKDDRGGLWLRSENIANRPYSEWTFTEKEGTLERGLVRIVNKESMGIKELHSVDDQTIMEVLFGEEFMFLSYLNAALLGVGDQNLRNNLLLQGQEGGYTSYLIDLEDNTGRKEITCWSGVFSKPGKKLESIILAGLEKYNRKEEVQDYIRALGKREDVTFTQENYNMLCSLLEL